MIVLERVAESVTRAVTNNASGEQPTPYCEENNNTKKNINSRFPKRARSASLNRRNRFRLGL